jgi:enterochelin esterase-like enzyme
MPSWMPLVPLLFALATLAPQPPPPVVKPDHRAYDSKVFGAPRQVWTYVPPGSPGQRVAGLIVFLWGGDYLDQIQATATLDTLTKDARIPRLAAVLLDDADDRFQDFRLTQHVADSIAGELIPWAKRTLALDVDPQHIAVAGYSAGGLAATYTVFAHPDAVGSVLSQSGAFWRGFEGGAGETEWLAQQFAAAPRRSTRFQMEVGGAETRPAGGTSISIRDANVHLADVLRRKGYDVRFDIIPDAQHEFSHWRAALPKALESLTRDWR